MWAVKGWQQDLQVEKTLLQKEVLFEQIVRET